MNSADRIGIVVRQMLRSQRWVLWAWILYALFIGLLLGATAASDGGTTAQQALDAGMTIRRPLVQFSAGPRWLLFAAGLMMTVVLLPTMLVHGVTRRTFAVAGGVVTVLLAVASAIPMAAGYLAQRELLPGAVMPHPAENPHLFDSETQVLLVVVEHALVFAAYVLGGWLVGSCFYRFGWLRGFLMLPLALLPLALVETTLASNWGGFIGPDLRPAAGVAIALSLLVLAIAGAAAWMLNRRVPIRPKTG
jgi:hypothetical protein